MNRRNVLIAVGGAGAAGYFVFFRNGDGGGRRLIGEPETYPVEFYATDRVGNELEGATFELGGEELDGNTTELITGEYTLSVSVDGYEDTETTFVVEEPDGDDEDDAVTEVTVRLDREVEDAEGEWGDDDEDGDGNGDDTSRPEGEPDLLSMYPRFLDYDAAQVTVEVPRGYLGSEYSGGGWLNVYGEGYGGRSGRVEVGSTEFSTNGMLVEDIDVDVSAFAEGHDVYFWVEAQPMSDPSTSDYLCHSDAFQIDRSGANPVLLSPEIDADHGIDAHAVNDLNARYRRDVGDGFYALEINGATAGTPWQIHLRVEKARYDGLNRQVGEYEVRSLDELPEITFRGAGGKSVQRGFLEALDDTGFDGEDKLRFFADVARSLPDAPDLFDDVTAESTKYPEVTLVDGGGDSSDLSMLIASLALWQGYDAGLALVGNDPIEHVGAAVAGEDFSGYSRFGDGNVEYFYLEPTRFNGSVGHAPEEVRDRTRVSIYSLEFDEAEE